MPDGRDVLLEMIKQRQQQSGQPQGGSPQDADLRCR